MPGKHAYVLLMKDYYETTYIVIVHPIVRNLIRWLQEHYPFLMFDFKVDLRPQDLWQYGYI